MQRVVQLGHGVLKDSLGLSRSAPQHRELLVQEPPLQLLLLTFLEPEGEAAQSPCSRVGTVWQAGCGRAALGGRPVESQCSARRWGGSCGSWVDSSAVDGQTPQLKKQRV